MGRNRGCPKTTLLSIYGRSSDHVGLGGSVFNDQVGVSRAGLH